MFTYRDERDYEQWERERKRERKDEVRRGFEMAVQLQELGAENTELRLERDRLERELARVTAELERHRKVWED